jgi:hypothetical protein
MGFDGVDIEPNVGAGWGSDGTSVSDNTFACEVVNSVNRCYHLYTYAVIQNAPTANLSFTGNTVTGSGLRIGVLHFQGYRTSNLTITNNSADTDVGSPAIEIHNVDTGTISGNTVPMSGGTLATVDASCGVVVSGNPASGWATEAIMTNRSC